MAKITNVLKKTAVLTVKGYQWVISPYLPNQCRFEPSCSHYAIEAISLHGILIGFYLTAKRLLRCHPWHQGGFDPVPGTGNQLTDRGN